MVFQSAYSEAYDLTQKMLLQHHDNLLVCLIFKQHVPIAHDHRVLTPTVTFTQQQCDLRLLIFLIGA